jgi:serine/threonine protein phosphatase PrpC
VELPTMRDLLKVGVDLDDAAHKLVAAANDAGGPDNITVLVLECRMN